jgi:hypothetical protein
MRPILLLCLVLISLAATSQTRALTDNGREVELYDNGTWKYVSDSSGNKGGSSIKTNPKVFTRPTTATFLVKSTHLNIGLYIDPLKWAFDSNKENKPNPEYNFTLKTTDGYALMMTEKTSIPLDKWPQIALMNARKAATQAKLVFAEYRTVNKKKVLALNFTATINDIDFTYMGYYYSNANGTVQLLSYTSSQLFETVHQDLENLLNGLVEIEK